MKKRIEMKDFIGEKKIISGRKNGKETREKLKISEIEEMYDLIEIIIPKDVLSFNSSYFLGMLGESVRKYKNKESFLKKYKFECNEIVMININDGINDALNNINILEE